MADVVHVEHGDGSHSIGVELDGVYVPFSQVTSARVLHLQDRAHDLGKRLENENDEPAKDAVAQLPLTAGTSGGRKRSSKAGKGSTEPDTGDGDATDSGKGAS